jgi:class 3 adenylate cyclase
LAQILFVLSFFVYEILKFTLENIIDFTDYSLINELVNLTYIGLYLLQALVLNFSIISKTKFLQLEVIAIGEKNRQILAEQNQTLEVKVRERTHELHLESQKSERLMLNILPQSIATRLKAGDEGISDSYQNATILFSDLVGFTKMSSSKTAEELVFLLNDLFKRFDTRATLLGLEKIKTIGDAYMVAGGLPTNDDEHAIRVTKMALGMYEDLEAFNKEHGMGLDMRIGINSGPVVAGVIGHSKFSYDLWGNTVNTASRMESTCLPGKVQVSPSTYEQIKGHFDVQENQIIECKGLGQIMTYFVK